MTDQTTLRIEQTSHHQITFPPLDKVFWFSFTVGAGLCGGICTAVGAGAAVMTWVLGWAS